ncbi:MAG TPA: DMT family transporter [Ferruginibacter sp.]|nr:DMT family transporter [Ferruginibacter sp.]
MVAIGLLTAFLSTICWAISVFPFTKASRLMTVTSMNLLRLLGGTMLVMLTAIIIDRNFFDIFTVNHFAGWSWLGISGIIALGIGDYFGLKMYTILSPRYGSVLTTLSPATALLLGMILLGENINFFGITGILVTIIGVMSISLGRSERSNIPNHGHGSIWAGILYGIISATCNGAALALSKKGFIEQAATGYNIHPITGSFIRFVAGTLFVVLVMIFNKRLVPNLRNIKKQPAVVLKTAGLGILFGPLLAVSFAMTCIQYIDVAVAQTIFALVPVMALIISHFIYKEKISRYAVIGVIAAIAGVAMLIWRIQLVEYFIIKK